MQPTCVTSLPLPSCPLASGTLTVCPETGWVALYIGAGQGMFVLVCGKERKGQCFMGRLGCSD